MLVRVADAREAAQAAAAGVDAVELIVAHGEIPDLAGARAVRIAFADTLRLRFEGLSLTPDIVIASASIHAEEIALALDSAAPPIPVVDAKLPPGLVSVAVVAPSPDRLEAIQRVKDRVGAIMLEAGDTARLVDDTSISQLDAFACSCRAAGLPFGLAGGLEAPDVARLLLLEPDVLGFDTAVRLHHRSDGALDPKALDAIRALIPREGSARATAGRTQTHGDHGFGVAEASHATVIDRVFVHDFVTPLSIGAYQAERGAKQRVRFSVAADAKRSPMPPHDMRDVFSYDVIIETIRVLSQRDHVTFVETLAEEIAASLLAHAGLIAVTVKVEKLDVIDGSVGIEITRRRPPR